MKSWVGLTKEKKKEKTKGKEEVDDRPIIDDNLHEISKDGPGEFVTCICMKLGTRVQLRR